jgi:hypothetical protein
VLPKKKQIFSFFVLVSFLVLAIVAPVSADISLHFIDNSFLGTNPVTITGQDGTLLFNGTTASIATIPSNFTASYWINFKPGGVTDYAKHPEYAAEQTFGFGAEHIVGIMVVCFVLVIILWRKH